MGIIFRAKKKKHDPLLSLERIFGTKEFESERFGPARWMKDGNFYATVENSEAVKEGKDIVLYSAATGRREILVSALHLIPPGDSVPLAIENYELSTDGKLLLIFTNTQRVWRQNTRGDCWVLDLASRTLKKLGRSFEPSMLMKLFSMMACPNRTHGISEGKNTTLHLYETLTQFLNQNLLPGTKTRT